LQQQVAIGLHGAAIAEAFAAAAVGIGHIQIACSKQGTAVVQRAIDTQYGIASVGLAATAIGETVAGGQVQCIGLERTGIAQRGGIQTSVPPDWVTAPC
jgi:hypothetical protein